MGEKKRILHSRESGNLPFLPPLAGNSRRWRWIGRFPLSREWKRGGNGGEWGMKKMGIGGNGGEFFVGFFVSSPALFPLPAPFLFPPLLPHSPHFPIPAKAGISR